MTHHPPLACTLAPGTYADRIAWIVDLNRSSLRAHYEHDGVLELVYEPSAAGQVGALIEREQECCAFLRFTRHDAPDAIHLRIELPAEARESSAALFAPFLGGAPAATSTHEGLTSAPCGPSCGRASTVKLHGHDARIGGERGGRVAGAAAVTGASAALVCGVCCVVPVVLPAVALTAFGGVLATVASGYRWAVVVAGAAVVTGWLWVAWQSARTRRRPGSATLRAMILATLVFAVASAWPVVESRVVVLLR